MSSPIITQNQFSQYALQIHKSVIIEKPADRYPLRLHLTNSSRPLSILGISRQRLTRKTPARRKQFIKLTETSTTQARSSPSIFLVCVSGRGPLIHAIFGNRRVSDGLPRGNRSFNLCNAMKRSPHDEVFHEALLSLEDFDSARVRRWVWDGK